MEVIRDIVGIRPARDGGVRVEKEVADGQNIVHAYGKTPSSVPKAGRCEMLIRLGTGGGGYVFSFGVARAAGTLVNDFLFAPPGAKL